MAGGARGEVRRTAGGPWTRTSARNDWAAWAAAGAGNRITDTAATDGLALPAIAAVVSTASIVCASGEQGSKCGRLGSPPS